MLHHGIHKQMNIKAKILKDTINPKIKENLLKLLKSEIVLDNELKNLSQEEWNEIIDVSKKQFVREYLYYNLKQNNLLYLLSEEQNKHLENSFKNQTFSNMALLAELKKISKILKEKEIPIIILKGLHLMQDIYPHIALRYSRDIDILIAKEAYESVKNIGYYSKKINSK